MDSINIDTTSNGSHTLRRARRANNLHQAMIAPGLLLAAFYGAWKYGPVASIAMCVAVVVIAVYAKKSGLSYEGRLATTLSIAGAIVLCVANMGAIACWLF